MDPKTFLTADQSATLGLEMPLGRYGLITDHATSRLTFVWTTHHAIHDGWSKLQLLSRVARAYRGAALVLVTG